MPVTAQQAVDHVDRQLETGFLNPVTHGEVKSATDMLANPQLSAADANAAVRELDRTGQLDRLAEETVDGSILGLGGLSATERQRFFASMAGKLGGEELAMLSNAFAATDARTGGHDYVEELGAAIATHATAEAKLDFVRQLAGATTDNPSHAHFHFGGSTMVDSDAEAAAVGEVLASLRGTRAAQGFAALQPDQLRAALAASIDATTNMSGRTASLSYDATRFDALMEAAASSRDADLKARVFDAGADVLRSVRDTSTIPGGLVVLGRDATLDTITGGLTRILDSDTAGVVRELAYNRETLDGSALSAYAWEMLNSGQAGHDRLGEFLARLQLGNTLQGDAVARFETAVAAPSGADRWENAGAMGYFAGAVYQGAAAISSGVAAQQGLVTAVLKSALTAIDKSKVGGPAAGTAASIAKEWVSFAVSAAIADPGNSAATQIERAALPIDPATGEVAVGSNARAEFDTQVNAVIRLGQP